MVISPEEGGYRVNAFLYSLEAGHLDCWLILLIFAMQMETICFARIFYEVFGTVFSVYFPGRAGALSGGVLVGGLLVSVLGMAGEWGIRRCGCLWKRTVLFDCVSFRGSFGVFDETWLFLLVNSSYIAAGNRAICLCFLHNGACCTHSEKFFFNVWGGVAKVSDCVQFVVVVTAAVRIWKRLGRI